MVASCRSQLRRLPRPEPYLPEHRQVLELRRFHFGRIAAHPHDDGERDAPVFENLPRATGDRPRLSALRWKEGRSTRCSGQLRILETLSGFALESLPVASESRQRDLLAHWR